MATRKNTLPLPNWTRASEETHQAIARPLSDIREVTEISLMDGILERAKADGTQRTPISRQSSLKRSGSFKRPNSGKKTNTVKIVEPHPRRRKGSRSSTDPSSDAELEASSIYSVPQASVPQRASSRSRTPIHAPNHHIEASFDRSSGSTITDHGYSISPLKPIESRRNPLDRQPQYRDPPRTFLRSPFPVDVLEFPTCRHARVAAEVQVIAPLFVGGGSLEGFVRVTVDDADATRQRKHLYISSMAVDLIGVEELVGYNRKAIFMSLATDMLDLEHPPPGDMVISTLSLLPKEPLWALKASSTTIPFRLNLPLDVGPTPFRARSARIRYSLAVTLVIRDAGKLYNIRSSQDVTVLSTYDPERALRSLPSPLTAYDEIALPRGGELEKVRLTAGLHRQVWVSGTSIFVDVHVSNDSRKTLKKLEISVERDILCYRHAAAATLEKSASQARIFHDKEQTILSKSVLKSGSNGWSGAKAHTSMVRTCEVDIPRGHASVRCGKFFEVRYFLNVTLSASHTKLVSIQLPIILIHMNSLDVLPNAVKQVAVAIEEKRHRHHKSSHKTSDSSRGRPTDETHHLRTDHSSHKQKSAYQDAASLQGRAFAAPRQQSLDRMRSQAADMEEIGDVLERSPRKYHPDSKASRSHQRETTSHDNRKTSKKHNVHKTPSLASIGAYAIFNGSTASLDMQYENPIPRQHQKGNFLDSSAEVVKDRLRNMRSMDSIRNRQRAPSQSGRRKDDREKDTAKKKDTRVRTGAESVLDYYFDGAASISRSPSSAHSSSPSPYQNSQRQKTQHMDKNQHKNDPSQSRDKGKGKGKGKEKATADRSPIKPRTIDRAAAVEVHHPTIDLGLTSTSNANYSNHALVVPSSVTNLSPGTHRQLQPQLQPQSQSQIRGGQGQRQGQSRSTTTSSSAAEAEIVTSAHGYSVQIQGGASTGPAPAAGGSVVRRASLKVKESLDRIDKSRFEFRGVGARDTEAGNNGGAGGTGSGGGGVVGAVRGWLGRGGKIGGERSKSRQRDGWI